MKILIRFVFVVGFILIGCISTASVLLKHPLEKNSLSKGAHNSIFIGKSVREASLTFQQQRPFDDSILVHASLQYKARGIKKILLGSNYRKAWATPICLPVFTFEQDKMKFRIVQTGGGQQTKSFHINASNGKTYVLRSVEKYTENAISPILHHTLAADVVQDQISASFPYNAAIVASLAEAAGILHTNPQYVYVSNQAKLGIYTSEIVDNIYIFEERPSQYWNGSEIFKNPYSILSTKKLLSDSLEINIATKEVLKARVLDILVNDWDRHDDQWKWAVLKSSDKLTAYPIPKDRDMAFYVNQGIVPWMSKQKWALRKNQGFKPFTRDIAGLNLNALSFDRSFLNEANRKQWEDVVLEITEKISDSVIVSSVNLMPKELHSEYAEFFSNTLMARKNNLRRMALKYYKKISHTVDIVGSDKDEVFFVEQIHNDSLKLIGQRMFNNSRSRTFYKRTFSVKETKNINIIGKDGNDKLIFKTNHRLPIRVNYLDGQGFDSVVVLDDTSRRLANFRFFTSKEELKNNYVPRQTKQIVSNSSNVMQYDRKWFHYNMLYPQLLMGFNRDERIYLKLGAKYKTHSVCKSPYSSLHKIGVLFPLAERGVQFEYKADLMTINNKFRYGFLVNADLPYYSRNYFGIGNNSLNLKGMPEDYYIIRWNQWFFNPQAHYHFNDTLSLSGSYHFEIVDLKPKAEPSYFYEDSNIPVPDYYSYQGVSMGINFDSRNDAVLPTRGFKISSFIQYSQSLVSSKRQYAKINSDIIFINKPFHKSNLTLEWSLGGTANIGNYEFYQSAILGNKYHLRGFRNERFYGRAAAYQNTNLRIPIITHHNYLFSGQSGLLFFNDLGRVWMDNEYSKRLHHGYGVGLWIAPFEKFIFFVQMENSIEDCVLTFRFGNH